MEKERTVLWSPWDAPGLEHLHIVESGETIRSDGMILGAQGEKPFHAHYEILCDTAWKVRRVFVELYGSNEKNVTLNADGEGHWTDCFGKPLPALEGCFDVDISTTPFTNTLPIRRLELKGKESAEIFVAYIAVPEMTVESVKQRYICLKALSDEGGLYRYEDVVSPFTAELSVDADGLVCDYPQLFHRVT